MLIDNKPFFEQETFSRNNDYKKGNLLDYSYHQKYCKLIGTDLSRQTNTGIPQQINFIGKLTGSNSATMFLLLKSSKKQF